MAAVVGVVRHDQLRHVALSRNVEIELFWLTIPSHPDVPAPFENVGQSFDEVEQ